MARQNMNKKYLICQIPIKILKQYAIPNSSFQNLTIFLSNGYRKTSQKWIMYVANAAILELWFSGKDITSDYGFLLRLVNAFTVDNEEYPLLRVHYFTLCAHKSYICILHIDLVLYIIGFDYFTCKGSTNFQN